MQTDIQVFPETRVAFVVGTNIAFLDPRAAAAYVEENAMLPSALAQSVSGKPWLGLPSILLLPVGYLAKDTQVIFGPVPAHKPAGKVDPAAGSEEGGEKKPD